jgi:hypothetical protein
MNLHEIRFRKIDQPSEDPDHLVRYVHKMDHRDKTKGKAQWRIQTSEERDVFQTAMMNQWIEKKFAWSLYRPSGIVMKLGVDRDHATELFIAKFDEHQVAAWHGYPCNHKEPQQRPPGDILADWLSQGVLPAAKIRKIASGQRCAI